MDAFSSGHQQLPLECANDRLQSLLEEQMHQPASGTEVGMHCWNKSSNHCIVHIQVEEEESSDDAAAVDGSSSGDVQKKITPWASSSREAVAELFPGVQSVYGPGESHQGLILVASLLQKLPNLGGIYKLIACIVSN